MIQTIIKHYIFDLGISLMFENINNNFNISNSKYKIPFAKDLIAGFKCCVCVTFDGETADWYDDMVCTEIGLIGCVFRDTNGITIRPVYDQIMSIVVVEDFGDDEGDEYTNDFFVPVYTDKDGNIRNLDTDELIDMDENTLIKHEK